MANWKEYTTKTTPEDADEIMIADTKANANKRTPFSGLWNWIAGKLATAVISQLETQSKSIIPALNELNSKGPLAHTYRASNIQNIEIDISKVENNNVSIPFLVTLCDWSTGECFAISGIYRGKNERQIPHIISDSLGKCEVSYETGVLKISLPRLMSYVFVYY